MPCSPVPFVYCACHPGCRAPFTVYADERVVALRVLVDVSVIEAFAQGGRAVATKRACVTPGLPDLDDSCDVVRVAACFLLPDLLCARPPAPPSAHTYWRMYCPAPARAMAVCTQWRSSTRVRCCQLNWCDSAIVAACRRTAPHTRYPSAGAVAQGEVALVNHAASTLQVYAVVHRMGEA